METTLRPPVPQSAPRTAERTGIPAPYNPYARPVGLTGGALLRWVTDAMVLSVIATLIWDRGTIRPEARGGFRAAPAQWVSAAFLVSVLGYEAFIMGAAGEFIPLFAAAYVAVRRLLAARGSNLSWAAAVHRPLGKIGLLVTGLSMAGITAAVGDWIGKTVQAATSGSVSMLLGSSGMAGLNGQVGEAVRGVTGTGALVCAILVTVSAAWWAAGAYRAQKVLNDIEGVSNV